MNTSTFLNRSCLILLITRKASGKNCRDNKNRDFIFDNFFFENCAFFLENVEKYCGVRQATDGKMVHAHCMMDI
jgi:hypothetical protein